MGSPLPVVPPAPPAHVFKLWDAVYIHIGPGTKIWRPGHIVKLTRSRATVRYFVRRGQSERRSTVTLDRVRPSSAPPLSQEVRP